jgi:hypothetical protein
MDEHRQRLRVTCRDDLAALRAEDLPERAYRLLEKIIDRLDRIETGNFPDEERPTEPEGRSPRDAAVKEARDATVKEARDAVARETRDAAVKEARDAVEGRAPGHRAVEARALRPQHIPADLVPSAALHPSSTAWRNVDVLKALDEGKKDVEGSPVPRGTREFGAVGGKTPPDQK